MMNLVYIELRIKIIWPCLHASNTIFNILANYCRKSFNLRLKCGNSSTFSLVINSNGAFEFAAILICYVIRILVGKKQSLHYFIRFSAKVSFVI